MPLPPWEQNRRNFGGVDIESPLHVLLRVSQTWWPCLTWTCPTTTSLASANLPASPIFTRSTLPSEKQWKNILTLTCELAWWIGCPTIRLFWIELSPLNHPCYWVIGGHKTISALQTVDTLMMNHRCFSATDCRRATMCASLPPATPSLFSTSHTISLRSQRWSKQNIQYFYIFTTMGYSRLKSNFLQGAWDIGLNARATCAEHV